MLVFGFYRDSELETPLEFVRVIVDGQQIKPNVCYRVERDGTIVKA